MKTRAYTWIPILAAMLIPAWAAAQGGGGLKGNLPPAALVDRAPCSNVDTRTFSPQVDETYVFHAKRPENPVQMPELPGVGNKLVPGKVGDFLRVGAGKFWPAIGGTGWVPPDPDLAVGKNHIVAVVNSSIAFFLKDGTKQFQQTSEAFFNGLGAGTFQYDPKVLYDRVHERFVIIFLEEDDATSTSKVLIAVSDDDDPNGTWHRYRIEAKLTVGSDSFWLDYPGFGYNKDAYMVCGNMFGFTNGWAGVQFLSMPSAAMLTGGTAAVYSTVDSNGASVQMAEMIDPTVATINAVSRSGTSALRVYSVANPGTSTPTVTFTTVPVPALSTPTFGVPSTNGNEVDPLDGRIFNVVVRGGHMVAGHCIQSGSMLVSRWYELDLGDWPSSGTPNLVQSGDVGDTLLHYFSPAININSTGQIGMIFSAANENVAADMLVAGRLPSDPAGSMGTPITLENSDGDNYQSWRWGDYFGVDVDPVDDVTFWGIAMGVASDNDWKTSIFHWTVTSSFPDVTGLTIDPSLVVGPTPSTGTVTLSDIAPAGGMKVKLKSSNTKVATVPAIVVVPNGQTSVTFSIRTFQVTAAKSATITATGGKGTATADINVNPLGIRSLTLNPDTVASGSGTTGTVVLGGPAPAGGALVRVAVDKPTMASVNWSLMIPEGQTTGQFPISTVPVGSDQQVIVRAANPGPTVYATLTLTSTLGLSSIVISPTTVKGGRASKATIYLTAKTPTNLTVTLSSDSGSASVPTSVVIKKGSRSATFTIRTSKVQTKATATISATLNSVTQKAPITINP